MNGYGVVLADLAHQAYAAGQHAQAEALLRLAVGAGGPIAHAVYFIGHLCYLRGGLDEAVGYLSAALELDPDNGHARNDLGESLRALGRNHEAIEQLERAIALAPGLAHAYGNLAASLVAVGRTEEALRWAQESLWRSTDKATAHCDLGSILGRLGQHKEAMRQYTLSLELRPDDARTLYFASLVRLCLGDLPAAWADHEGRLRLPSGPPMHRQDPHRAWTGGAWTGDAAIEGRVIVLYAEQGLGDTIQFVRYAPLVADRGATVLLEVQPGLRPLLRNLQGVTAVYEQGEPLPFQDLRCPLMSLPFAFQTGLDTIPGREPYLAPAADRVGAWRSRLGPWRRMRIGLAWSGSAAHANDHHRSLSLPMLADLLNRTDVEFHVVQRDIRDWDRAFLDQHGGLTDHALALTDFGETAALVSELDLIVSVDTVLAHLAGAIGKPAWIMLPHAPDWRWMTERADSPWYPTLRLFRQPRPGAWEPVLQEIGRQLDLWADQRG